MLFLLAVSMPKVWTLLALVLGATLGSIFVALLNSRRPEWGKAERRLALLVPWLVALTMLVLALRIYKDFDLWDGTRLSPVAALVRGEAIYTAADDGVVLPTIYPPGSYLAYLPTSFASTPGKGIFLGRILSSLYFFGPVIGLLVWLGRNERISAMAIALVACAFVLGTFCLESLSYSSVNVHADAPTLGLACLGLAFALGRNGTISTRKVIQSGVFICLALYGKQTLIFVPMVAAIWLLSLYGRKPTLVFAITGITCGLLLAAFTFTLLGVDFNHFKFNTLTLPRLHAWTAESIGLIHPAIEILAVNVPLVAGVLVLMLSRQSTSPEPVGSISSWAQQHPSLLFLACGVCGIPFSFLGFVKIGGDVNSMSLSAYFLLISMALELLMGFTSPARPQRVWMFATYLLVIALVSMNLAATRKILVTSFPILPEPKNDVAFNFLQKYPGRAYFPEQPLAHLMAEGNARHSSQAMIDRILADFPISPQSFEKDGTAKAELICWKDAPEPAATNGVSARLRSELPPELWADYSEKVEIPELPGWHCYRRPLTAPSQPAK